MSAVISAAIRPIGPLGPIPPIPPRVSSAFRSLLPALLALALLAAATATAFAAATPLPQAHAHNDYEHARPLLDALDHGFVSIEADVFLIEGQLHVAHNRPKTLDPARTLTKLYLEPLAARIKANGSRVYPGYDGPFYLMIDFKTAGPETYARLRTELEPFRDLLRHPATGRGGPVTIFISGGKARPFYAILSDPSAPVALDATPEELGLGIPATVCPVVSVAYGKVLTWRGEGEPTPEETTRLKNLVRDAHAEGKKVRLWAAPQTERVWTWLLDQGVDLLNVDDLARLQAFLTRRATAPRS